MIGENEVFRIIPLSAKWSKRNPTWHSLGNEPYFRGERSATNCLKLGTTMKFIEMPAAGRLE